MGRQLCWIATTVVLTACAEVAAFSPWDSTSSNTRNHDVTNTLPCRITPWVGKAALSISTSRATTTTTQRLRLRLRASDVPVEVEADTTQEEDTFSIYNHDSARSMSILKAMKEAGPAAVDWAGDDQEFQALTSFYALFRGIRDSPDGSSTPFFIKNDQVQTALLQEKKDDHPTSFAGFYTMDSLAQSLQDEFLDASRGSTDNRKGWKSHSVSSPRGDSFEEARMTFDDVNAALEKGTVIFNSAGAHISELAGPCLASLDATSLPPCLNMYITAPHKRTSAPPHTDKQDVAVIQTSGAKHWRVYSPPNPSLKPTADRYARGKGNDDLPLHMLESMDNCKLLLEITMTPGDVLFIPAAFPHTTDTLAEHIGGASGEEETSIHLTLGMDTHIWDLDYLSARRLALRKAVVPDTVLGQEREEDNKYVGNSNLLPATVDQEMQEHLPFGFLDEDSGDDQQQQQQLVEQIASELERRSRAVDEATAALVPPEVWKETVERLRVSGMALLDIHRRMFTAATDVGEQRQMDAQMAAALGQTKATMTPERMQRLSIFRVPPFFEEINAIQQALYDWSGGTASGALQALPDNWELTLPLKIGDEVEADLGGAMFPAKVTGCRGSTFDVQFFDGDQEQGLERSMIKLLKPPAMESDDEEQPPPGLTTKELKRWKKKLEKKKRK